MKKYFLLFIAAFLFYASVVYGADNRNIDTVSTTPVSATSTSAPQSSLTAKPIGSISERNKTPPSASTKKSNDIILAPTGTSSENLPHYFYRSNTLPSNVTETLLIISIISFILGAILIKPDLIQPLVPQIRASRPSFT